MWHNLQYLVSSRTTFYCNVSVKRTDLSTFPTDYEQDIFFSPPPIENYTDPFHESPRNIHLLDSTPRPLPNQLLENDPFNINQPRPDIKRPERGIIN